MTAFSTVSCGASGWPEPIAGTEAVVAVSDSVATTPIPPVSVCALTDCVPVPKDVSATGCAPATWSSLATSRIVFASTLTT